LLVYSPEVACANSRLRLAWLARNGDPLGDAAPEGPYNALALSPDRQRVALTRSGIPGTDETNGDIWLWDFARQTNTRITFGAKTDENPVWSPDGRQIAFSSNRDGSYFQIYRKDASGAGVEERLTNTPQNMDPLDWSPDGRYIVYRERIVARDWISCCFHFPEIESP
jgi:Tol biopolymer transport system component